MLIKLIISYLIIFFSVATSPTNYIEIINNHVYFKKVKQAITTAPKNIHIIMFEMKYYEKYPNSTSNQLINALINAASRGVKVNVLLEISEWNKDTTLSNLSTGSMLKKHNVKVYYDDIDITTHCKLIIIDDYITIIGSTNWTYHGLTKNNESAVLIKSKSVAKQFKDYFYKILKR